MSPDNFAIKILFLLFFGFSSIPLWAQPYSIDIQIGAASFNTVDLKLLQEEIESDYSYLKITDRFPSQPYLQISFLKEDKNRNNFGVFWGYTSTGGRVTASDYSGGIRHDQILINHELGFILEYFFAADQQVQPYIDLRVSGLISKLELIDEAYLTSGESLSETTTLHSLNAALLPSFGLKLNHFKLPVKFKVGYLISITEFPFHLKENRNAKIKLSDNNYVGPGLTGLRIGLSTEFSF